ncbi:MAG: ABC transporter ATP-binding protein, partial [Desulfobacterales bacterium]|nr:ABC transporter ATP-binding protein [Desulfobacterales bacterium]
MKLKEKFELTDRQKNLLGMIRESWLKLFCSMICLLIVASTTALLAYLVKPILDDVFISENSDALLPLAGGILLVFLLQGAATYIQSFLMGFVGQDVIRRYRNNLYDKIQDLPLSFFHEQKTGVLMSRITNDVNIVKNMVTSAVTGSIKDSFTIVGLTFVIFYQIPLLAACAFIVLPIAFFPIIYFGRRVRRYSTGCQEAMADLNSFLHETFAGSKIVKAFGMEKFEKKRFFKKSRALFNLELKEIKVRSISSPLMEFLGGVGIAFIVGWGGSKVIDGTYTTGTYMSFLAAVLMLYAPVKKLSRLNNAIQKGLAASDRIYDILETESTIREEAEPVVIQPGPHGISFERVHFKYDDVMVLKDIHLQVKPGEVLALVGKSGGGKTSMVNLIPRFYDVARGAIKIDDLDIRKASVASLREQIAIVTQEPILFNDTV